MNALLRASLCMIAIIMAHAADIDGFDALTKPRATAIAWLFTA